MHVNPPTDRARQKKADTCPVPASHQAQNVGVVVVVGRRRCRFCDGPHQITSLTTQTPSHHVPSPKEGGKIGGRGGGGGFAFVFVFGGGGGGEGEDSAAAGAGPFLLRAHEAEGGGLAFKAVEGEFEIGSRDETYQHAIAEDG